MKNPMANKLAGGLSKLSQAASARKDSVSGTVVLVKPSDCYEEGNPRTDFDSELIASYAEDFLNPDIGQEEAIQIYPADHNGKHRIQHGATRHRAGLIAEQKNPSFRLKAIIDEELTKKDELENYLNRGMNNIKRDNMTLRDRANFIGNYMDKAKAQGKNVTQAEIAKRLGLKGGASYISRLLKLRDMSPEMNAIYLSGKIDDIEALATLADLQKENNELFTNLVALPDLDRAAIRRAKKTGEIFEPKAENSNVQVVSEQGKSNVVVEQATDNKELQDSDDSIITIPYFDYQFKTGRVNILIKHTDAGFAAALETIFEHGINEEGIFDGAQYWSTEDEAIAFGKEQLRIWADRVVSDKDAVSLEEYQDVAGYIHWLKTGKQSDTTAQQQQVTSRKQKAGQLNAVVFVDVNGEEGVLLLKVPKDHIDADGHNDHTNGFVYVQIGSEIRAVKNGEYVIKSVSYRE
ncbi:hypothetical protein ZH29_002376 [Salmonella enterica subsp. enterica]|nr:hypothetical protein [Salmonella enterica subsp. enterica]